MRLNIFGRKKNIFYTDKECNNIRKSIKNIFGFKPENIFLYKLAFSHKSSGIDMPNGQKLNNERLEYLGDAILGAIVGDYLFKKFPTQDEGFLTEMRSKIVCRENLNKLCIKIGLNKLIIYYNRSSNSFKSMSGDAFEAFIGAVYLDKGYNFTKKLVINRIIKINIDVDELINESVNAKSQLFEWAQKEKKKLEFRVSKEISGNHNRQYYVDIYIDDEFIVQGCDFSIKGAEKNASQKACLQLIDVQ